MAPCSAAGVGVAVLGVVCAARDDVICAATPGSGAISMAGCAYTAGSHESPRAGMRPRRPRPLSGSGSAKYWRPTEMPLVGCCTKELIALDTPVHLPCICIESE